MRRPFLNFKKSLLIVLLYLAGSSTALFSADFMSRKVFKAAINAFREKNYYSARLLLQEIIHKDRMGEYADDAQYYTGLAYYYEADYTSALFEFNVFLRDFSPSEYTTRVDYWIGECHYYLKDYRSALQSHYDFIKKYPDDKYAPYAYYTIGYIYNVQKRYDDAAAEFEKALTVYPASKLAPKIALQLGIAHYNNREFPDARKKFEQMIMTMQDSEELESARLWIGKTWYSENNFEEAQKIFLDIIDKFPDREIAPDAIYHMALTRYKLNDLDSSITYLKKILEKYRNWPEVGSAYFRLGQIYQIRKEFNLAAYYYKAVVDKFTSSEFYDQALELLADCYQETGDINLALEIYNKILEKFGVAPDAEQTILKKKGNLLFLAGDYRRSAMAFEKFYEKYPASSDAPEAMYMRAQSHYKGQMYNVALDILQQLEKKYPRSKWKTDATFLEGEIYYALTDYTKALQAYNRIIRYDSKHERYFDSMMGVGWSYFELKQYARASDWFRRADKVAKNDQEKANVMLATASCMYNLGGFDKAIDYYRKLVEKYPNQDASQEADFQIAWVHYRQGDFEKAREQFGYYIEKYPEGKKKIEAIYFNGWSFYNHDKYPEAIENFKKAYESASDESVFKEKALLDYSKTLGVNRQHKDAIENFKKFLKEFPQSASIEEVYYVMARTYLETDQPGGAEAAFRDLKTAKSSSAYANEILREISTYYRKHKKYQLADKTYKMIIDNLENPEQILDTSFQRIHMYSESGNYEEALKISKSLLESNAEELSPFRIKIVLETIGLYIAAGKLPAALELINTEKEKKVQDPLYAPQLSLEEAKIYLLQKNYEKSRAILAPLLEVTELSISARYYTALGFYHEGKNLEAMEFFHQVIQKTGEEYFAAWSFYYLGEIRFLQSEYLTAAREYTKIIYLYSGNNELYEKALYRASLCFKLSGKNDEHQTYLQKLAESFPESKYITELK